MNDKQRNSKFKKERTRQLKAGLKIRKDTYAEIKSLLNQAEADIKVILATQPSDYQQWMLPKIQQQIRNTLDQVAETSATKLSQSANTSWQMGLDLVDQPIAAGGIRIAGTLPHIDMNQLTAMRTFMVDRMENVPLALAEKISSQLGLTMIGSQSVGDTLTNIATLFEKQGRSRALTIIRTELGRAYSVATQQRLTQASKKLPGLKKQWRRSGKVHSRLEHDTIDGEIYSVDKPFVLGNGEKLMFPRDPAGKAKETINCGCESLPWMESWKVKTPGKKAFTPEEIARNPMKADLAHAKPLPKAKLEMPRVPKAVRAFERQVKGGSLERALVLDTNGNVLSEMVGDGYTVQIPTSKLKDAIVIHNHPVVSSFSKRDIETAATSLVKEMRLVDDKYRYMMRPGKKGWNWKVIESAYEDAEAKHMGIYIKQLLAGKITEKKMAEELHNRIWLDVTQAAGVKYTRRKR